MPQNCTILCPTDDPRQVVKVVRELAQTDATIDIVGGDSNWSKIEIRTSDSPLALNRQVRVEPGDAFSKMVLGMHNYFRQVNTAADAIKQEVLNRVEHMALLIGVVAEPEFVDADRHYDYIFGIAEALGAVIWTGSGVINTEGKVMLDGDGASELG